MFKALVFSDIHIGNNLPHAIVGNDGVTDRLIDSCEALDWVFNASSDLNVPVYCLGDFFNDRLVDSVTLKYVGNVLKNRKLHIIPGNHDASDQTNKHFSPEGIQSLNSNIKVFTSEVNSHSKVAMIQFGNAEYVKNWIKENASKELLLLAHMEVTGYGNGGNWKCSTDIQEADLQGFGAVLSGHFHCHQKFRLVPGCYIGALRQLEFSDEDKQQGAWLVTWDGESLDMKFIKYEAPVFKVIERHSVELLNLNQIELPKCSYLKIKIRGSVDQIKQVPKEDLKLLANEKGIRNVIFEDLVDCHHTKKRLEVDSETPLFDLIGKYVNSSSVNIGDLDSDELLKIGKEILEESKLRMR